MPGTLVFMTPNSPRYSTGASGLGSHMSIWLGPPRIHRMMTDGWRVGWEGVGLGLQQLAQVQPGGRRSKPALTKLRRSRSKVLAARRCIRRCCSWRDSRGGWEPCAGKGDDRVCANST